MASFVETRKLMIGKHIDELSNNLIPTVNQLSFIKTNQKNFNVKFSFYERCLILDSLSIALHQTINNAKIKDSRLSLLNEELGELISKSYLLLKTVKLIKSDTNLNNKLQSLRISLYNNGLININQGVRK